MEKYLLDEGKIVRFLVGARPRTPCRIILKIRDFTRFMPIYEVCTKSSCTEFFSADVATL